MAIFLYAGLLCAMFFALTVGTIRARRRNKTALGLGNAHDLQKWIHAHGNFAEYTTFVIPILGLLEFADTPLWFIHAMGSLFLVGRVSHAYSLLCVERYKNGMLETTVRFRVIGMACTLIVIGSCGLAMLLKYFAFL